MWRKLGDRLGRLLVTAGPNAAAFPKALPGLFLSGLPKAGSDGVQPIFERAWRFRSNATAIRLYAASGQKEYLKIPSDCFGFSEVKARCRGLAASRYVSPLDLPVTGSSI
jgi:hypothetical protein